MEENLGLVSNTAPVSGEKATVLRRVTAEFLADGSVRFEGSLCERLNLDGQITDLHWQTPPAATYPSQTDLITLAAANWQPTQPQLDAMAAAIRSGPEGAAQVIFSGFIAISKMATQLRLNPPAPPTPLV